MMSACVAAAQAKVVGTGGKSLWGLPAVQHWAPLRSPSVLQRREKERGKVTAEVTQLMNAQSRAIRYWQILGTCVPGLWLISGVSAGSGMSLVSFTFIFQYWEGTCLETLRDVLKDGLSPSSQRAWLSPLRGLCLIPPPPWLWEMKLFPAYLMACLGWSLRNHTAR